MIVEKENKNLMLVYIVIAVIAVIAIGYGIYSVNTNNSGTSSENSGSDTANPTVAVTYEVSIINFTFVPKQINIKKGDSIRWTNRDIVKHTITEDNRLFASDSLMLNQNFEYTFNQIGNYSYSCLFHPDMNGIIIVSEK